MGGLIDWIKDNHIIYLTLGFIFSVLSIGRYNTILSIYIWPFCFLHFLHNKESKLCPTIIVCLCILFSNMIRWIYYSNINIGADFIIGSYFSIINIIPFIIDIILYNRIEKWQSVLLFPLSVSFIEFLFSFLPIANFNIYAYAHRENTQYLQIISLFGCYFLSFVIALFSSILDYSIFLYKSENKITKFIYSYIIIVLCIYLYGVVRLLIPGEKETYNIASSIGVSQYLYEKKEESVLPIEEYTSYIEKTLEKAKYSDSKIMLYAEEAFAIYAENKTNILEEVKILAKTYKMFILLPLDIENEEYNTNEAILISDEGVILYNYTKQHLIPYIENDYYIDNKNIKIIDTKLGKLTTVICYDINFPYFINSLSRKHFDILLIPSWDWDGIAEFHSNEVKYRAIEGGFNLVKNTAHGIVISCDYKGRITSYYIGNECNYYFIVSTINQKGIKTLYSYIGFLFNYIYILAYICILISGVIKNKLCPKNNREFSYGMHKLNDIQFYNEEYEY